MKRISFNYVVIFIVLALLTGALLFVASKVRGAVPQPAKKMDAENTCATRLDYENKLQECKKLHGKQEEDCRTELKQRYHDCVRLELIRNADTVEEALKIEESYLGRPLTSDEALRVTAETMFDEYTLRGNEQ